MSLSFSGPAGAIEQRWIVYALLRDNVQHHLEGGVPTAEFAALHGVTGALGGGVVQLPAVELRREILRAASLLSLPIAELAISLRTRSVLSLTWPLPDRRETMLVREGGGAIPLHGLVTSAGTLSELLGGFVERLIAITAGAAEGDVVEVRDL